MLAKKTENSGSRLQQDDPSIIHCTVKKQSVQQVSNANTIPSKSKNNKKDTKSAQSEKSKLIQSKDKSARRSAPIFIQQQKHPNSTDFHYKHVKGGDDHLDNHQSKIEQKFSSRYYKSSQTSRTFASSHSAKNKSSSVLQPTTQPKKVTDKAIGNQLHKTGTLIDSLMPAKANFDSEKYQCYLSSNNSTNTNVNKSKDQSRNQKKFGQPINPKTSASKSRKKVNPADCGSPGLKINDDDHMGNSSGYSDLETKKTRRPYPLRRKKNMIQGNSSKSSTFSTGVFSKTESVIDIDKKAGKEILSMVNGGGNSSKSEESEKKSKPMSPRYPFKTGNTVSSSLAKSKPAEKRVSKNPKRNSLETPHPIKPNFPEKNPSLQSSKSGNIVSNKRIKSNSSKKSISMHQNTNFNVGSPNSTESNSEKTVSDNSFKNDDTDFSNPTKPKKTGKKNSKQPTTGSNFKGPNPPTFNSSEKNSTKHLYNNSHIGAYQKKSNFSVKRTSNIPLNNESKLSSNSIGCKSSENNDPKHPTKSSALVCSNLSKVCVSEKTDSKNPPKSPNSTNSTLTVVDQCKKCSFNDTCGILQNFNSKESSVSEEITAVVHVAKEACHEFGANGSHSSTFHKFPDDSTDPPSMNDNINDQINPAKCDELPIVENSVNVKPAKTVSTNDDAFSTPSSFVNINTQHTDANEFSENGSTVALATTSTLNQETDKVGKSKSSNVPKMSPTEAERMEKLALEQAEQRLRKEHIALLKTKPANFPKAKFLCKVCKYHLDGITSAQRHVKEKRHKKNLKDFEQDEFLRNLTMPADDALTEIQELLTEKVIKGKALTEDDVITRTAAVEKLNCLIRKHLPTCKAVLYGSSCSGIGFKVSDVNVDLQHGDDIKAPSALLEVLDMLTNSDLYSNVRSDFNAKIPRIYCDDVELNLHFQISTGNELAILTSRLLHLYALLDYRVTQLCMVFRTWARICQLDQQHDGALPPHAIPLMAIFFMQDKNYLPVLHEIITEWDMKTILSSNLKSNVLERRNDQLWYNPTDPPTDLVENKVMSDDSGGVVVICSDSESDYEVSFVQQEQQIDFSFLSNLDVDDSKADNSVSSKCKTNTRISHTTAPTALCGKCTGADKNLATLFLEMLKFYSIHYQMEDEIINVCSSTRMVRADKKWSKKRIAVIDPYSTKRNLCRSLNTQGVFTYFMNRLKALLLYFFKRLSPNPNSSSSEPNNKRPATKLHSTPSKSVEAVKDLCTDSTSASTEDYAETLASEVLSVVLSNFVRENTPQSTTSSCIEKIAEDLLDDIMSGIVKMNFQQKENAEKLSTTAEELAKQATIDAIKDMQNSFSSNESNSSTKISENLDEETTKYNFEFSTRVLTGGKFPVKVCGLCKKEGHPRVKCPDEMIPLKLKPLKPLTASHKETLNRICQSVYDYFLPTSAEVKHRDEICRSLASYLQKTYNSNTNMSLFGSSRNGFGFEGSDLDICMTFAGNPNGENLDTVSVIKEVAKQLRKNPHFWNIHPITTAKVPIVKFYHRNSGLEGDISLYNVLAQRNTSMLRCYSQIDRRCKILGYVIKAFVKLCNIGDASRGSLSSYAYTLMVVFYLQQKEIPVLPVLQELYDQSKKKPEIIVDGWNSWFYGDIGKLSNVWNGYGKNRESVGQLWLGLLRFYTEEFNFRQNVVCIRQKKPLTTFEKEWTSKFISIEDPFDLNHNLAAGVSHKMTNFIIRVFIKAREHFGSKPKEEIRPCYEMEYYFNQKILMDGEEAPNDRCCRICGKIGHYVRDCPKNKRNKQADGKDNVNASDYREVVCFYCNEPGHMKRECPFLNLNEQQKSLSSQTVSPTKTPKKAASNKSRNLQPDAKQQTSSKPSRTERTRTVSSGPAIRLEIEEEGITSNLSRSLSEDFKINSDTIPVSTNSKRLFERGIKSNEVEAPSPVRSLRDQVPEPSAGIHNLPKTPDSVCVNQSSVSPRGEDPVLIIPPFHHHSPHKSISDTFLRTNLSQINRSASILNYPLSPSSRSTTTPFPISPYPNSPIWGINPNPSLSPIKVRPVSQAVEKPNPFVPLPCFSSPTHRRATDFILGHPAMYRTPRPGFGPFNSSLHFFIPPVGLPMCPPTVPANTDLPNANTQSGDVSSTSVLPNPGVASMDKDAKKET